MGIYLNPDNMDFQEALNSKIYIDKTGLIELTNDVVRTQQKYVCVSRPRRFGKSMAANMLTAYYSRGCDSKEMFSPLKIAASENFEKHLNKYNVIHINMVEMFGSEKSMTENLDHISKRLLHELKREYAFIDCFDWTDLISVLNDVFAETKVPFVFIIDEWDCIFRMKRFTLDDQTEYLNFLRNLLKDKSYVALAYMTGILPIKKYGEHSALNMFTEISVIDADVYAEFTGFTNEEVNAICEKYGASYDKLKQWYDGYCVEGISIYNPRSVVESIRAKKVSNYWTKTETYEALKVYIQADFDGLHDKVTRMIAGEKIEVNTAKFQNDMTNFGSADDVLTLLIHLGYLTYNKADRSCYIPNEEVRQEFINCIEDGGWENVMSAIRSSERLLEDTLKGNEKAVSDALRELHYQNTSLLTYTTSPIDLTDAIERLLSPLKKLKLPVHELAMMMTIALRFIPTLIEETDKIMSAQKARGADMESGTLIQRAKALIPILIPLFVSSIRRAEELALAMECRCYHGGEGRTRMKQLKTSLVDYVALAVTLAFMAGVIAVNHLL